MKTCEVVELELEKSTDAVFLQVQDNVFVAIFGSPGWPGELSIVQMADGCSLDVIAATPFMAPLWTDGGASVLTGMVAPPVDG